MSKRSLIKFERLIIKVAQTYVHSSIIIINKNLYFTFISLTMYMIFIIDHIHLLINKFKMLIFVYNNKPRVYNLFIFQNMYQFYFFLS